MIKYMYFRCFAHATEDLNKVKKAFEFITNHNRFDVKEEKGYYGNRILILELQIKKKVEIIDFWKRMKEYGVVDEILPILPDIVDDHGMLYLRFDKQEAYLERMALTAHGDSIAMRAKIESYPMKKIRAIENFKKFVRII